MGKKETNAPIEMLSITNSFGVPSVDPTIWQKDVKKSLEYVGHGQMLILSFMGTTKPNQTEQEFLDDFALSAKLAKETGAKVLEVNLSCPNIGNEGLVCYNLKMTEKVLKTIREHIDTLPLIVKVGYYKDNAQLEKLAEIVSRYAQAIAAINTLQIEIVDEQGNQALPGKNRLKSGVCGACIKWAGIEMVEKLDKIRKEKDLSYEILGVGGVMTAEDYFAYRSAGADAVQSATGAMWDSNLAHDIWKKTNT
jgi:dihydroorotate dehydrogenase